MKAAESDVFMHEFFGIKLTLDELPQGGKIKAGTMFLVPHDENVEDMELPDFTLLMGGQELSREMYPELSSIFTDTGGFYKFIVPNLEGKFLLGFDENGKPQKASAAIYFQDVPPKLFPVRDIR